ncbi:MAG: hypothetical protein WCX17_01790 [Parcubacteria group bacterium]|jgi:hypothetical protein
MEGGFDKNLIQSAQSGVDMRNRVMNQIKKKRIKMRSPLFFVAEKAGLESILMLAILGGALAVSVILYVFKKTGALNFLKLGVPGLKVFLLSFPYDYLALFLITLILGSYVVHKLNFSLGIRHSFNIPATALLVAIVFLGSFFAVMGGEQLINGLYTNRVMPEEMAVMGEIMSVTNNEVVIQEENGRLVKVGLGDDKVFPYVPDYAVGKFLRAVGKQDSNDSLYFHAENISCCTEK